LETIITQEGKYPDRQAFNKDGWLVTFPSKEYRDAAIKKGTHSISDPTHGKGGMNLYYKRKGKQKRQTQQATLLHNLNLNHKNHRRHRLLLHSPQKLPLNKFRLPNNPLLQKDELPPESDDETPLSNKDIEKIKASAKARYSSKPASVIPAEVPRAKTASTKTSRSSRRRSAGSNNPTRTIFKYIKKFADKKGWKAEPYGEYRDIEGNTIAVVGLSGEVVPIKSVDRDEYKIFAEKSMV
jgi:hypothetical protein